MFTIHEVSVAEAKMRSVQDALKTAKAEGPNYLHTELECASDEYARAVGELKWMLVHSRTKRSTPAFQPNDVI
jgi:hypothetical protein